MYILRRLRLRLVTPLIGLACVLAFFVVYNTITQSMSAYADAPDAALAQAHAPVHGVVVPWGLWLAAAISSFRDVIVSVASMAIAAFATTAPFLARSLINEFLTKSAIEHAVDGAIARVDGAIKGKEVSLPVAQGILLDAERYIVQHEPAIQKRLGNYLIPRIQAQMTKAGVAPPAPLSPPLPGHAKPVILEPISGHPIS